MTVRTVFLTVGATFALLAPATAQAVPTKPTLHTTSSQAAITKHHAIKSSPKVVTPRLLIVVPTTANAQTAGSNGVDYCTASMVGCTDEQYCDIWGFNCDVVGSGGSLDGSVTSSPVVSTATDG